jgi:DNA-binding LacI/PurR family transcriptional regulator
MSSVRTIAQRAGVSITTVSRALNNDPAVNAKTRELVLRVASSSGYVAKTGRLVTTNIGLAYTQDMTVGHSFDSAVLSGVLRGLGECRFDVTLLNLQRDKMPDETFSQFFTRKGVRGIVLRTTAETSGVCQAIADEGFPHVVISERFDSPNINCIDCDSRPDSARAVEYLIALGHRRIGFAAHNVPDRDHQDRLEG